MNLKRQDYQTLYLLRHGESVANVEGVFAARKIDPPLSLVGRKQILGQKEVLSRISFDACYTSPLLRAKQSAEILSETNGLKFNETDKLLEVDVGILDGKPQTDRGNWSTYENVIRIWERGTNDFSFPDGENLEDIKTRFLDLLKILEQKRENRVLLLGHCLLFMCVIWLFIEDHGPTLESGHMGRGHLSIIEREGRIIRLLEFNKPPR